jgi:hypothetical protein
MDKNENIVNANSQHQKWLNFQNDQGSGHSEQGKKPN